MEFWSYPEKIRYEDARSLQHHLVERRLAGEIPDTILFLEHVPVITRGRGLQWTGTPRERAMPLPGKLPSGIEFSESERGGDLTYHGPGQLVVYPICLLDGEGMSPRHDVAGFIRMLEQVCIQVLADRKLTAQVRAAATGVWIGSQKIASIGIAVRKWVTYHGLALNVSNDLAPFHLFSPCGFNPEVMTRLTDLVSNLDGQTERLWLEQDFARHFCAFAHKEFRPSSYKVVYLGEHERSNPGQPGFQESPAVF